MYKHPNADTSGQHAGRPARGAAHVPGRAAPHPREFHHRDLVQHHRRAAGHCRAMLAADRGPCHVRQFRDRIAERIAAEVTP